MAGPILTFLDNLQERQPVRNALRGVLGLPQRRSTVINSMDEMAARDAEMGGDISNPYPNTRMAPRIASTATTGQGVADALPTPPQAQVDETQPYKGMGMVQAMVTPPSAAIRQQRQGGVQVAAGRQATPTSLSEGLALIHQNTVLPAADRAQMSAELVLRHAQEATDNDRRATLVRIGEAFMKQHAFLSAQADARQGLADARTTAEKIATARSNDLAAAAKAELELVREHGNQTRQTNQDIQKANQTAAGRPAAFDDYVKPLDDQTLTITNFADQNAGSLEASFIKNEKPVDPVMVQAERDRAFDVGFSRRLSQITANSADANGLLQPSHPAFGEVATHYRMRLAKKPAEYDQLLGQIAGQIASSAGGELRRQGYSIDAILNYSNRLAQDILGPKPKSWSIYDLNPLK